MATFENPDWRRIDFAAIVAGGVSSIREADVQAVTEWLSREGYEVVRLDCGSGLRDLTAEISALFSWTEQFGYTFSGRSLDALRDGFDFPVRNTGGTTLLLSGLDRLWGEDKVWAQGLLSIAAEHSRFHAALGSRFFTIVVCSPESFLIGKDFDTLAVPYPWRP